ncbi:MAG TPA: hypothetical protein VLH81_13180, partial [Desulfobacterales bacterium]|nr:hypothetical protein [Desulfobacterales bacterium]
YRLIFLDTGTIDTLRALPEMVSFTKATLDDLALVKKIVAAALTGPASEFERNFAEFLDLNRKWGADRVRDAVAGWMREHYETDIVPNIVVDRTRK